jgi:hypothetical protein
VPWTAAPHRRLSDNSPPEFTGSRNQHEPSNSTTSMWKESKMPRPIGIGPLLGMLVIAISSGCCCIDGGTMIGCDMTGGACGGGIITGSCSSCTGGSCGGDCGSVVAGDFGYGGPLFYGPLFGRPLFPGYCTDGGCTSCNGNYAGSCGGGCDTCGYAGSPYGYGPIMGVLGLIRHGLACGYGCGPLYWDEWFSDPPLCHDPCGCGDCGGGCSSGCGCASSGGESYLSERSYDWGHPEPSCPDGSCGASHSVHRSDEIIVGQAPTTTYQPAQLARAPQSRPVQMSPNGQTVVRRVTQTAPATNAPLTRRVTSPQLMQPAATRTASPRQVSSGHVHR